MRAGFVMIFAAFLVGCASGPRGAPAEHLAEMDARRCGEQADMFSALAMLRASNVGKRQAIDREMKARNVAKLERSERKAVTSEVYESAIMVYAIGDFSPATLRALKWSECKTMALNNKALNYGDIVAIKDEVMQCQTRFEQKSSVKHKACIEGVVNDRSQTAALAQQSSKLVCRNTIKASIKMHKKAVKQAESGSKKTALGSLEKSMENWKSIANGTLGCSNVERAIAADGILRASQDITSIARI